MSDHRDMPPWMEGAIWIGIAIATIALLFLIDQGASGRIP